MQDAGQGRKWESDAVTSLGSGATVAQLTLDQKVEGSNPSSPATSSPATVQRLLTTLPEELPRRVVPLTRRPRLMWRLAVPLSASADRSSAPADQRMSWTASLRERPAISVSQTRASIPTALLI